MHCNIMQHTFLTTQEAEYSSRSIILGQIAGLSVNVPQQWKISPDYLEICKMRNSMRGKRKMDYGLWNTPARTDPNSVSIWGSDQNTHIILVVSQTWFVYTDNSINHEGILKKIAPAALVLQLFEYTMCSTQTKTWKIDFGAFLDTTFDESDL